MSVKVLILTGEGINAEIEMQRAFQLSGAKTTLLNITEWKKYPARILDFHILVIPGGFSYADELGSGHILALEIQYVLSDALQEFIQEKKGLILGICNGFQVLLKLGLFDLNSQDRKMSLVSNKSGKFINSWVKCMAAQKSLCHWTKGLGQLTLPIRHGEGRLVIEGSEEEQQNYYQKLMMHGQIALNYADDVNGSYQKIAGLTDHTGQILGMMPHPEAAMDEILYPWEYRDFFKETQKIFSNAIEHVRNQRDHDIYSIPRRKNEASHSISFNQRH